MRHALAAVCALALWPAPARGGAAREAASQAVHGPSGAVSHAPAPAAPGAGLSSIEAARLAAPLEASRTAPAAASADAAQTFGATASAAPTTSVPGLPRAQAQADGMPRGMRQLVGDGQAASSPMAERGATGEALFDGSRERAALEIARAGSVDEALDVVERGGWLEAGSRPAHETDRLFLLKRAWSHLAPAALGARLNVDRAWAVPAIRVERDGVAYFIHPVRHGKILAPGRPAMARLVEQIERAGHALYSEQNLPLHYGFARGGELADHEAEAGAPARVVAPARGMSDAQARGSYAVNRGILAAAAAGSALWLASLPLVAAVPLLAALAFAAWLTLQGLAPLERWGRLWSARRVALVGGRDHAEQWRQEADALLRGQPDPLDVLRLRLPPGPGAAHDRNAARSESMARAVRDDAAAAGAAAVHVVVGYEHAAHVAWRLAQTEDLGESPRPNPAESQTS